MAYRKFDKYGIVKRLAMGGISEIFLAREDQGLGILDRHVVIKKLLPQFAGNKRLAAVIQREAQLLAALYHANIVQVYDAGITENQEPYLVLEYIQGQDLRAIFQVIREGNIHLESSMVYYILEQVLRALVHLHELSDPKGRSYHLVHRDLSPTNIMCSMSGDVKLLDFGLARRALDITGSGNLTGKLPYLSPEQIRGGRLDARSDLFALGTVFYELCTGHFRYEGKSDIEILSAIRERRDIPLMKAARHHPPELLALIAKACEYDPSRRPSSAREMLEELTKLPAVVPFLHGGRTELVDFMEFHFGATRIDSTLPVNVSSEKPISIRSFNLASLDPPTADEIHQETLLQETFPQGGKARSKPSATEDWFEPLLADPALDGTLSSPPSNKTSDPSDQDVTRQGWKIPATPNHLPPSPAQENADVTRQSWKMPLSSAPPAPTPSGESLPKPPHQTPTGHHPAPPQWGPPPPPTPLPPPPVKRRPPLGTPHGTPPIPKVAPPPQWAPPPPPTPLPPNRQYVPSTLSDSTVPVPPLAFDMFNDETHYLAENAPPPKRVNVFSHSILRIWFPVVGIVLLLMAAWLLLRPAGTSSKDILITLEGDTPQATAYIDNAPLGTLPVTFAFPRDGKPHDLRVEAPKKIPWRKTLHPSTVQPGKLQIHLQPLLTEIKIVSTTPGVEVRIANANISTSQEWLPLPLLLSDLEPGTTISIEARLKKKKWETQIRVPETTYQEIAVEPPFGK